MGSVDRAGDNLMAYALPYTARTTPPQDHLSSTPPSQQWYHLPLFRLLALLDSSGIQPFDADVELQTTTGMFLRPPHLLVDVASGALSPLSQILACAVDALEDTLRRLSNKDTIAGGAVECDPVAAAEVHECLFSSPAGNAWRAAVSSPTGLRSLEDAFEAHLPLTSALQLHSWWGSPSPPATAAATIEAEESSNLKGERKEEVQVGVQGESYSVSWSPDANQPWFLPWCPSNALVAQFIIDGLDQWLRNSLLRAVGSPNHPSALQQIVLSCGGVLAPDVVIPLLSDPHGISLLIDFVMDVLFPISHGDGDARDSEESRGREKGPRAASDARDNVEANERNNKNVMLIDWLMISYHKNREVGAEMELIKCEATEKGSSDSNVAAARKRGRGHPVAAGSVENDDEAEDRKPTAVDGWLAPVEDGDVYLSSDNIDVYMRQHPERLPRAVVTAKRKSYTDPSLTSWELQHHYTAAELRTLVKTLVQQHEEEKKEDENQSQGGNVTLVDVEEIEDQEEEEEEDGEVVELHLPSCPKQSTQKQLSPEEWERAKKMTRKNEFITFLLQLYERDTTDI